MSEIKTHARAVADVIDGLVVASVEIARTPERVFQALSSREIVDWWVNPGVFDTREWHGDVRDGAHPASREARPMRWRANFLRSIRRENWCKPGSGRECPARRRH
jgi:uncharacterized protein YndB with AHSA1/START domain